VRNLLLVLPFYTAETKRTCHTEIQETLTNHRGKKRYQPQRQNLQISDIQICITTKRVSFPGGSKAKENIAGKLECSVPPKSNAGAKGRDNKDNIGSSFESSGKN